MPVDVKNEGGYAGKTPVQIYVAKPNTSYAIENGIQVPSVELIDFGNTGENTAGQTQSVSIELNEK